MTLRAIVGETVQLHFLALHTDRVSPYIGLTDDDFTKSLAKDDVAVTDIDITVTEIGSTGQYVLSFVPDETGFWWAQVRVDATNDWYGEPIRVLDYATIDNPDGVSLIYENNIIYLLLDSVIAATDGSTLDEDYLAYFTTTYNPLYASVRQVRLDIGPFISKIPDDTVNLAIFEAGIEADAYSFQSVLSSETFYSFARHKYTQLTAELILLNALMGDASISTRMAKSLGELTVSRGGMFSAIASRAESIRKELQGWLLSIQTGGDTTPGTSLRPQFSVKGALAADSIYVGRQWEPTSGIGTTNSRSAGNSSRYMSGRRDLITYRRR